MDRKLLHFRAMPTPPAQSANHAYLHWAGSSAERRSASQLSRRAAARGSLAVVCAGILCAGMLGGCAAPTLPLPPPDLPTVTAGLTTDTVHLASIRGAQPNAILVVFNNSPVVPRDKRIGGAQADAAGSWDTEIFATAGDCLQITQDVQGEQSTPLFFCLPPK